MSARNAAISGFKIKIFNKGFKDFPKNLFQTAEVWCIAMRGLVAYKNVKCSKSIPGFSTSRLAIVEDFF